MSSISILLVEDEPRLAEYTKQGLEQNGFEVEVAFDGQIGKTMAMTRPYDLLVFDINIPKLNGLELTHILRDEHITTPILLLTAMGSINDKVAGLDSGADDYLVKPFDFLELIARLKALNRRLDLAPKSKILKIADLELDINEKMARRGGQNIALTNYEFLMLEYFIKNKHRVITRNELAEKIWNITFDTGNNKVDVYINFLRKKIDQNFERKLIHTVIGMGYIMKEFS